MKYLLVLSFFLSFVAHSAEYPAPSTITALTFSEAGVRVKMTAMSSSDMCPDSKYYYLDTANAGSDKLVSVLLAAKLSQQKIWFQLNGCAGDGSYSYKKITHVYLCDTMWCS